ncbi:MAG: hypothetical protein WB680_23215 [Candidatus Acidiferrales bacterium]
MFGIVKSIEAERGVIWIASCGLNGGTIPALVTPEIAAQFNVGQHVVYLEGKLAAGVRLPRESEMVAFAGDGQQL